MKPVCADADVAVLEMIQERDRIIGIASDDLTS